MADAIETKPVDGRDDPSAAAAPKPLNQGRSAQEPAEGADDTPGELPGSPQG